MRVLVISNEVWNDKVNGNNVTSNWFEGMDAEFANIYASPGNPYNNCCATYFQITDSMMAKSIITKSKAGKRVEANDTTPDVIGLSAEQEPQKLYSFLKSISGSFLRFIREEIWLHGKYNTNALQEFILDFNPDIIFSERMASCKILRLEKIVTELCNAPIVAFTGDDEYSLKQLRFSPFYWINRFKVRKRLRKMVKKYHIYYTLSLEQKMDYEARFGCKSKILQKCGDFSDEFVSKEVNDPIRLIYAGKFYCNRWKALAQIVNVLKRINKDSVKMILEIYTRDIPTKKQEKLLNDGVNSFIRGGVSQEQLKEIYQNADVALHVESCDLKNRLTTRLSFSTKIIDCIASSCAVLAYCWNQHSGWTYLKRENAAICVSSECELEQILAEMADDTEIIKQYAKNAYNCGIKNHQRKEIQRDLMDDFKEVILKTRED